MNKGFEHLSFLDLLRPDPGWQTDYAVFATYTADPVVLIASLLALSGVDHDEGSGSKVDFATAHESLEGKVKFVIQAGQLIQPSNRPAILGILDSYLTEMQVDEHVGSWHPKLALVRYKREVDNAVEWRFWLGSRNLTRDMSYDMGLSLESSDQGHAIEGLSKTCIRLLQHSGLKVEDLQSLEKEIESLNWKEPEGCTVESVHLWSPGERVSFPEPPKDIKELLVVSPFLDGTTLRKFRDWGDDATSRYLLSSTVDLSKLATQKGTPFQAFADKVFYLERPSFDPEVLDVEEGFSRGLHAKIIGCNCKDANYIWMGSSNMTQRGWGGGNAECSAKMKVDDDVYVQLREFVSNGIPFDSSIVDPEEADPEKEALEEAHKRLVAQWQVELSFKGEHPILTSNRLMDFFDSSVELRVGLLSGEEVLWPKTDYQVKLPLVKSYQMTKLLRLTLRCGETEISWMQAATSVEGLPDDRDRQLMAHYLSTGVFLQWLKSLLLPDVLLDGGGDWDEENTLNRTANGFSIGKEQPQSWAPSLEEILRAWNRDPHALRVADQKVRMYAQYLEKESSATDEAEAFKKFLTTWKLIVEELPSEVLNG